MENMVELPHHITFDKGCEMWITNCGSFANLPCMDNIDYLCLRGTCMPSISNIRVKHLCVTCDEIGMFENIHVDRFWIGLSNNTTIRGDNVIVNDEFIIFDNRELEIIYFTNSTCGVMHVNDSPKLKSTDITCFGGMTLNGVEKTSYEQELYALKKKYSIN